MLATYLWFWGRDQGSTWSRGSGDPPEVPEEKQGCRNGLNDWEVRLRGSPKWAVDGLRAVSASLAAFYRNYMAPTSMLCTEDGSCSLTKFPIITKMVATSRLLVFWHARVL
jgi:hypothetical protein